MKIRIDRTALLGAVTSVGLATAKKSTLPALEHMRVETIDGGLRLVGTDTNAASSTVVPCVTEAPGGLALHAQSFRRMVDALPEGDVSLSVDGLVATLSGGTLRFELDGLPTKEMPAVIAPATDGFAMPSRLLLDVIEAVKHAANTDDSRAHLCGVLIGIKEGLLTAAATDGRRGAVYTRNVGDELPNRDLFVPARMFALIQDLCSSAETVTVADNGARLFVSAEAAEHQCALPMATLTWQMVQVIQRMQPPHEVTFDADALAGAVRSVLAGRGEVRDNDGKVSRCEAMVVSIADGQIRPSFRRAATSVPCSHSEPGSFGVDPALLLDALRNCSGETRLQFATTGLDEFPVVLNGNLRACIAPMRI